MRLYALSSGEIIYVASESDSYGDPPAVYAEVLEIDQDTNPQIVAALTGRLPDVLWQDVRLSGGVLTYKGQLATVNPPGAAWQARVEAEDAKARIPEAIDAALADYAAALANWDKLTTAQVKTVVKRLIQVQIQILRYHRRELL